MLPLYPGGVRAFAHVQLRGLRLLQTFRIHELCGAGYALVESATATQTALSGLFGLFGGMRASGRSCPKAKSAWRGLCREMRDSNIAISNRSFGGDAGEAGRTNGGVVVVNYNGQFTLR